MAEKRIIGAQGKLPWSIPEDMQWFRQHTMGKAVIMGAKTFLSLRAPLKGRHVIVLTRSQEKSFADAEKAHTPKEAINLATKHSEEIMIAGGGEIYPLFMKVAHTLYITRVFANVPGDTVFPFIDSSMWKETLREDKPYSLPHPICFTIMRRTQVS